MHVTSRRSLPVFCAVSAHCSCALPTFPDRFLLTRSLHLFLSLRNLFPLEPTVPTHHRPQVSRMPPQEHPAPRAHGTGCTNTCVLVWKPAQWWENSGLCDLSLLRVSTAASRPFTQVAADLRRDINWLPSRPFHASPHFQHRLGPAPRGSRHPSLLRRFCLQGICLTHTPPLQKVSTKQ